MNKLSCCRRIYTSHTHTSAPTPTTGSDGSTVSYYLYILFFSSKSSHFYPHTSHKRNCDVSDSSEKQLIMLTDMVNVRFFRFFCFYLSILFYILFLSCNTLYFIIIFARCYFVLLILMHQEPRQIPQMSKRTWQ